MNLKRERGNGPRGFKTACGAVVLIALAATGISTMSASAGADASGNHLVGAWLLSVDRGPSLPALKALQTYTKGHGVVQIANGGTALSPAHGAWQRITGRTYATTVMFFRYDPANGTYLGTVKLRHTLELSSDGQSYSGVSVPEFRDPAGNLLPGSNTRRDAVTATRINAEAIPEQP